MSQSPTFPSPPPFQVRERPIFTFKDSTRGAETRRLLSAFVKPSRDGGVVVNVAAQTMLSSASGRYLVVKLVVGPPNPDDQKSLKSQVQRARSLFERLGIDVKEGQVLQVLNPAPVTATPGVLSLFFGQLVRAGVRIIASITGEAALPMGRVAESAYWEVPNSQRALAIKILTDPSIDLRR